jgi:hypothetical protein
MQSLELPLRGPPAKQYASRDYPRGEASNHAGELR